MKQLVYILEDIKKTKLQSDLEKANFMLINGIDKNKPDYYIDFIYNSKELSISLDEFLKDVMHNNNEEDTKSINELKDLINNKNARFFYWVGFLAPKTKRNYAFAASGRIFDEIFGQMSINDEQAKDYVINNKNYFSFVFLNETKKFKIYFIHMSTEKEEAEVNMLIKK